QLTQPRYSLTDQVLSGHIREILVEMLAESLDLSPELIKIDESFADYGLDSIIGVQFIRAINERLGAQFSTNCLFDYPSVEKLTAHILLEDGERIGAALLGIETLSLSEDAPAKPEGFSERPTIKGVIPESERPCLEDRRDSTSLLSGRSSTLLTADE